MPNVNIFTMQIKPFITYEVLEMGPSRFSNSELNVTFTVDLHLQIVKVMYEDGLLRRNT